MINIDISSEKLLNELEILKSGIGIKIDANKGNENRILIYKNQLKMVDKCMAIVKSQK